MIRAHKTRRNPRRESGVRVTQTPYADPRTREQLESLERQLLNVTPLPLLGDADWAREIPSAPGVYVIWEMSSRDPVYVGATSSLQHRMRDLRRSANHTCRRKIAAKLGMRGEGDAALSLRMSTLYLLSFLPVSLARTELEEYLMLRWKKTLMNPRSRRVHHSDSYRWAELDGPKLADPLSTHQ